MQMVMRASKTWLWHDKRPNCPSLNHKIFKQFITATITSFLFVWQVYPMLLKSVFLRNLPKLTKIPASGLQLIFLNWHSQIQWYKLDAKSKMSSENLLQCGLLNLFCFDNVSTNLKLASFGSTKQKIWCTLGFPLCWFSGLQAAVYFTHASE